MGTENVNLCYWTLVKKIETEKMEAMLIHWFNKCKHLEAKDPFTISEKQVKYVQELRQFLEHLILCFEIYENCNLYNFKVNAYIVKSHLELYTENQQLKISIENKNRLIRKIINPYLKIST